jgi:hypothetical protein
MSSNLSLFLSMFSSLIQSSSMPLRYLNKIPSILSQEAKRHVHISLLAQTYGKGGEGGGSTKGVEGRQGGGGGA